MTITDVVKYYETNLPLTNKELYEMVEEITIRELKMQGLEYLGKANTLSADSICLKRTNEEGSLIWIRNYEDSPSIAIIDNRDIQRDIIALSGLLKISLEEFNPDITNDLLIQRYRADQARVLENQSDGTGITTIIRRPDN